MNLSIKHLLGSAARVLLALLVTAAAAQAQAQAQAAATLHVAIDLRAEIAAGRFDPQRDAVGVRGALAPLSWMQTLAAGDIDGQGVFRVVLRFEALPPAGQPLAYKFKIDRPGAAPDDGWEAGRNRSLLLRAGGQTLERAFGSDPEAPPPQRSGRIERLAPMPSAFVAPREVQVWLPPQYDTQSTRRYRVLYLHDGQNVFDALAAGAEWSVDEVAQRLVLAGEIDPIIVVAVAHAGNRLLDYTPVPGRRSDAALDGGGAPAYARYLIEELKPLIDSRFRTRPGAAATAVGGSSLGGLVSVWLLLQHPEVFSAALVLSPSVWWADAAILKSVASAPLPREASRIWLDIGTREGHLALRGARDLRDALLARGWPVQYSEAEGAGHDEAAWAARVEPMLKFLYPVGPRVPPVRVRAVPGTGPATADPAPGAAARGASAPR